MSKLLSDYVTLVQKEVDDASTDALSIIQRNVIDTYQEMMEDINQYIEGTLTEDTVVTLNKTDYPVTQDANIIHQVAYKPNNAANFKLLNQITLEDYKNDFINRPGSVPTNWFLDGDVINIAPQPGPTEDGSGIVRRVYTPNITEPAITDTSLIPDRYTRVVMNGAIYRFKFWENNVYASLYYQQWYEDGVKNMILNLSTKAKTLSPKLYGR